MIISLSAKCNDMCGIDAPGISIDGYVPYGLGIGGGDYIDLQIDMATGKLVGFEPMADDDVLAILEKKKNRR